MENNTGFIIIHKPKGPSSHAMVNKLRHITGIRRIGHAGTLDPFASGVLIMAIGRESTKRLNFFLKMDKEYVATIRLGIKTDTFDAEGKVISRSSLSDNGLSSEKMKEVLSPFVGKQAQVPPMFSAKKFQGKKLYQLARKGIVVVRQPAEIEIHEIEMLAYDFPVLKIRVKCSSGTYIRSLAHDIGEKIGIGASLEELERLAVGCYTDGMSKDVAQLTRENWRESLFDIQP